MREVSHHTAINVTTELLEPPEITPADGGDFRDMASHGQFTVKQDSEVADHVKALDKQTAEL